MIQLTNLTPNGDIYPVQFSDDFTLEIKTTNANDYEIECEGLTDNPFTFTITKENAEQNGSFDAEKTAKWLFDQITLSVAAFDLESSSSALTFSHSGTSGDIYTIDISGDVDIEHLSTTTSDPKQFEVNVVGLCSDDFSVFVDVDDAGGNESAPDPGDIVRWLLEKLKDLLCPSCL